MTNVAIYGAGGFGREVKGMLELEQSASFAGFIDDLKDVPALADSQFDDVLIAIAHPAVRKTIIQRWSRKNVPFKRFVSADINPHPSVNIGRGSILCPGVKLTVNITVGDFVIINLNSTIGHDSTIGNYVSLMPSVNVSGNVTLKEGVFVGTGATILQGITIGENAVIGAGSVILHDVPPNCKVIGVPGRIINS